MAEQRTDYKFSRIQIALPKGTARFPHVHTPDEFKGKKKFKLTVVFDADADLEPLRAAALKVALEAWPKLKPEKVNVLIKDGDAAEKDGEPIEELAGKVYLTATCNENHPPKIVGPDKAPLTGGTQVRGRDIVRAVVSPIPSDTPTKGTVAFRLLAVQLVEKQSGGGNYADLFDEEGAGLGETKTDSEPASGIDAGDDSELPF